MSAPLPVELTGLGTRFGPRWVLRGINLQVPRGALLALVGGSGSGKTTLLRQIVGLLTPTEGQVSLFGEPLQQGGREARAARRRRFGMLFQHGALFSALNVFDNVAFPLRELRTLREDEISDLVFTKLGMVEIDRDAAWRMPAELSGGMIKRIALARALALDPELLLLDEPTAGLDPDRSAAFVQLIRTLHEALNLTVVFVTHDLDTLAALANRIAVLSEGQIIATGTLDEVVNVDHPFIERFFRSERSLHAMRRGMGTN
ncbi:ATP-binding cassette domain-containing protein [Niveibacterium sp. 24ML]|uniref:ABC transporter ATP-binding protein n=1 Tax=Niveibacterium sp. 24ML TaxID=2985512 RepID=UPI002271954D|nr:ATP-binding cassette domain-containing protein [Niveibacterium sp. 24ML]MCX9156711.1 ATP-binding cassette domain-containing protein [Niveibacterium sp. 24ML]